MASPRTRVDLAFRARTRHGAQDFTFAPGRLVLLGEHLDHQGGRVLAIAERRGVHVAWGVRPDRRVVVHALDAGGTDAFVPGEGGRSGRRWADLSRGTFAALAARGVHVPGLDLVVASDLPPRRGLASSAAFMAALLRAALAAIGGRTAAAGAARTLAAVEREWAGVACGPLDPYVAWTAPDGGVLLIDCERLTHETLSLPAGVVAEAVDTGIERRLDQTPYDARRAELEQALALLRREDPALERLVDLSPAELEARQDVLPEPLRQRARHVVGEAERVGLGAAALRRGDADALAREVRAAHQSLAGDFDASLPQVEAQVAALEASPGVLAVRLQGAGWGGSLLVLRRAPPAP